MTIHHAAHAAGGGMETGREFLDDERNRPAWFGGPTFNCMDTQIGEHHWRDGFTFRRMPHVVSDDARMYDEGSIRIRRWYRTIDGEWRYKDIAYIPANEWESIVREVATPPASAPEVKHG